MKCTMFMDWTTQNYKNDAILPRFYIKKQRIYPKQFSKRKKLKFLCYLISKLTMNLQQFRQCYTVSVNTKVDLYINGTELLIQK